MTSIFRRAYGWLTKPTYIAPKADDVVELGEFPSFQQADELRQLLVNVGIVADVYSNSGLNNAYGRGPGAMNDGFGGYRLMVRGDGLEQSRQVLADFEDELRKRDSSD